jgi:hypothetical protein
MRLIVCKRCAGAIFAALLSAVPVAAQLRVDVAKHATRIPKACLSVVPASIEGQFDVAVLVKEAICKGAGDMLNEYSYSLNSARRVKDKKGTKESTTTYEVFIPTLKAGTQTRGILVITSRDGVPVPPDELEKERTKAASDWRKKRRRSRAKLRRRPRLTQATRRACDPSACTPARRLIGRRLA